MEIQYRVNEVKRTGENSCKHSFVYAPPEEVRTKDRICVSCGRLENVTITFMEKTASFEEVKKKFLEEPLPKIDWKRMYDVETSIRVIRGILIDEEKSKLGHPDDLIYEQDIKGIKTYSVGHGETGYYVVGVLLAETNGGAMPVSELGNFDLREMDRTIKEKLEKIGLTEERLVNTPIETYIVCYHSY